MALVPRLERAEFVLVKVFRHRWEGKHVSELPRIVFDVEAHLPLNFGSVAFSDDDFSNRLTEAFEDLRIRGLRHLAGKTLTARGSVNLVGSGSNSGLGGNHLQEGSVDPALVAARLKCTLAGEAFTGDLSELFQTGTKHRVEFLSLLGGDIRLGEILPQKLEADLAQEEHVGYLGILDFLGLEQFCIVLLRSNETVESVLVVRSFGVGAQYECQRCSVQSVSGVEVLRELLLQSLRLFERGLLYGVEIRAFLNRCNLDTCTV